MENEVKMPKIIGGICERCGLQNGKHSEGCPHFEGAVSDDNVIADGYSASGDVGVDSEDTTQDAADEAVDLTGDVPEAPVNDVPEVSNDAPEVSQDAGNGDPAVNNADNVNVNNPNIQ